MLQANQIILSSITVQNSAKSYSIQMNTHTHTHAHSPALLQQEAQLMLTTGSTRLAVSRGQQTWYHSTCYI